MSMSRTSKLRRAVRVAIVSACPLLLATACSSGSHGPAAAPSRLYQQSLTYSRCMRSHGVRDFPILRQGPGGSLVHPVSPPAGMLTAHDYDAAFRACLKLAVVGGPARTRYEAAALHGLKQAECMRAHGVAKYPSPGTLDGGIHVPDFTGIGVDPHTLRFESAAKACGVGQIWQVMWWWPAAGVQPGPDAGVQPSGTRKQR